MDRELGLIKAYLTNLWSASISFGACYFSFPHTSYVYDNQFIIRIDIGFIVDTCKN